MSYEDLLNEAYEKVKPIEAGKNFDRWEIPSVCSQVLGTKTIVSNYLQVCSYIRRDCNHLAKFLAKELATFSKIDGERLILNRKVTSDKINSKLETYIDKFVVCAECKKPDTELLKQDGFTFIHCLACGAKHSLGRA